MIAKHIHKALEQVHQVQLHVLERQRFRGYSGRARIASGSIALLGACILSLPLVPASNQVHLLGWGAVFLTAILINYGAVTYWFFYDPKVKRDLRKLRPILDVFPPLFVGAVLSAAVLLRGHHGLLFGIWMCLFGISNLVSRHVLPRSIAWVGIFYLGAGTSCLFIPELPFTNPWPMGIVFCCGEWAGGLILHFDGQRNLNFDLIAKPEPAPHHQR